jgi:hypothetical protein
MKAEIWKRNSIFNFHNSSFQSYDPSAACEMLQ